MRIIRFLVKLVAKVLVMLIVFFLGFLLLVYNAVEGLVCFLAGIMNVIIVVGVFAAYFNTGSWDLAKPGLIFFAVESVLLGVPQLCVSGVKHLHESLKEFVWA